MKNSFSKSKLVTNFSSLRDADVTVKGEHVVESMTDNPNFPTPSPTLEDVATAITEYSNALARVASRGTTADVIIKDPKRAVVEETLTDLADYVEETAGGDAAILASSGFTLAKTKTPVGVLPKPEEVILTQNGNKGSVALKVKPVPRADFYEVQFAELPQTNGNGWQTVTSKKSRKIFIDGLTSGKQYIFRVAAAGSNPERVWSNEITSFVL